MVKYLSRAPQGALHHCHKKEGLERVSDHETFPRKKKDDFNNLDRRNSEEKF
jgi:hypothetical protein